MHPRIIAAIFRKDLRDAIRDARVLFALLVPLGIGLFYNFVFDDTTPTPSVDVAITSPDATRLPDILRSVAGSSVELKIESLPSADEVRQRVVDEKVDIGLILPAGFDSAVQGGSAPQLTVLLPRSPGFGGDYVAAALQPALRQLAGQAPPATVNVDRIATGEASSQAIFDQLGLRRYFVLVALIMLVAMISMLAVPIILTEEVEKKTLDALVMIASYADVVLAKALVGLVYIAVASPLLLAITGISPGRPVLFAAGLVAMSLVLIGFGLFIGGLFHNANQVNTWSGVFLIPIIAPAFIVGLPLPDWADKLLLLLPTSQAARVLINAVGDRQFFDNIWLAFVVLAIWGALAYTLLARRLAAQQA